MAGDTYGIVSARYPGVLPGRWERTPGLGYDIGVGADGTVFVVGLNVQPGGFGIHRWTGNGWRGIDGGASRVAVDPAGAPWVVNTGGKTFRRVGNAWTELPGRAFDIAVGADGTVYKVGMDPRPAGFGVHRWTGADWQYVDSPGAHRIAVDPAGSPWIVNRGLGIAKYDAGTWRPKPDRATDIGIAADGSVFIVGRDMEPGGFGIHRWNGAQWDEVGGGALAISVDPQGCPWVVNDRSWIFRRVVDPEPPLP